jgi:hypothetical protein
VASPCLSPASLSKRIKHTRNKELPRGRVDSKKRRGVVKAFWRKQ